MPNEHLENLLRIGKLKVDPSTDDEVMGLIQRGLVKIEDFKHPGPSRRHSRRACTGVGGLNLSRPDIVCKLLIIN
jgi:hypothetical protein